MIKRTFFCAMALISGSIAFAQFRTMDSEIVQEGDANITEIKQIGQDHVSDVLIFGDKNSTKVHQNGYEQNSSIEIGVKNESHENAVSIEQSILNNKGMVEILGDANSVTSTQVGTLNEGSISIEGDRNIAIIDQEGENNFASNTVANTLGMGNDNSAEIIQKGDENRAINLQEGSFNKVHVKQVYTNAPFLLPNVSEVIQSGEYGSVWVDQTGYNQRSFIVQHSTSIGNQVNVVQSGNANYSEIDQYGKGNLADVQQSNLAEYSYITQKGQNDKAYVIQKGGDDLSIIDQNTLGSVAKVMQSGAENTSIISQDGGAGNSVDVTQQGTLLYSNVVQNGLNNVVEIVQQF